MENYSPLRYPGGKSALYPAIANIIESNNMKHCIYIEPFAGGANIAWSLLINGIVDYIIINDADKSIYSFWRAITESTHWFIEKIESVSVTVDEWRKQRAILQESSRYSKELGFAMFFLNRTNRSGILDAGPIGGYDQSGTYKIDNDNLSMPRNKLSFEDAIAIHTLQDLKNLEALTQTSASNIRNIQIQPTNANFLRDRDVIGRIGTVAKGLGASILLEGGILSHAYYQLIRTGAKVQVRYSFEKRQQFEFNKLVRDKIPEKIEKNGEEAVTAELNKELFSSLLKRKLVEEALEVLDSKNDEDIIAELADILEVLDGILSQYQIDFNTVLS